MKKHAAYWALTGLFAATMTMSGAMTLAHQPPLVAAYAHLGYPAYLMTLLGAAKLAGVATLLAPGLPRLKEWAYAGFAVNLLSALFSHASVGDPAATLVAPALLAALGVGSWALRPAGRTLASPDRGAVREAPRAAALSTG